MAANPLLDLLLARSRTMSKPAEPVPVSDVQRSENPLAAALAANAAPTNGASGALADLIAPREAVSAPGAAFANGRLEAARPVAMEMRESASPLADVSRRSAARQLAEEYAPELPPELAPRTVSGSLSEALGVGEGSSAASVLGRGAAGDVLDSPAVRDLFARAEATGAADRFKAANQSTDQTAQAAAMRGVEIGKPPSTDEAARLFTNGQIDRDTYDRIQRINARAQHAADISAGHVAGTPENAARVARLAEEEASKTEFERYMDRIRENYN